MRLELPINDYKNFKKIMKNNNIKIYRFNKYKGEVLPKNNVITFSCHSSKEQLINIMKNEGADLHYGYDTLKPIDKYTGNRYEDDDDE